MKCPECGEAMRKGVIIAPLGLFWRNEKKKSSLTVIDAMNVT